MVAKQAIRSRQTRPQGHTRDCIAGKHRHRGLSESGRASRLVLAGAAARATLGGALSVADQLPAPDANLLRNAARSAFTQGLHVTGLDRRCHLSGRCRHVGDRTAEIASDLDGRSRRQVDPDEGRDRVTRTSIGVGQEVPETPVILSLSTP